MAKTGTAILGEFVWKIPSEYIFTGSPYIDESSWEHPLYIYSTMYANHKNECPAQDARCIWKWAQSAEKRGNDATQTTTKR